MTDTLVTPALAAEWLGANKINRNLSKDLVAQYALDMVQGRWRYNPNAGIIFGKKTGLLDGQHRLHAIIQAETLDSSFKGARMPVYRDVDDETRRILDIGRVRSLHDVLHMEGHPYGTIAGAAAMLAMNFLDGARMTQGHSKPEKYEFLISNPEIFRYATLAAQAGRAARPSALAAVLFLGTRAGELVDHAERFAAGVGDGAELRVGDPRLTLRNAIFNARGARGGTASTAWAFAATANAWNNFVANRELLGLRVTVSETGEFVVPPILGAPARGAGRTGDLTAKLPAKVADIVAATKRSWEHDAAAGEGDSGLNAGLEAVA